MVYWGMGYVQILLVYINDKTAHSMKSDLDLHRPQTLFMLLIEIKN